MPSPLPATSPPISAHQRPVRLGIIGVSPWVQFMYLWTLKKEPEAVIVALCATTPSKAEPLARKIGATHIFTDYRTMYESGLIDAVIIAAPDDCHYQMALDAIERGLHVLCEKPLALTALQAQTLHEHAVRHNIVHMVMFTYRWLEPYRYIYDVVQSGVLGDIKQFDMTYQVADQLAREYDWYLDAHRSLGAVGGLALHMIDLALWIVGRIQEVSAHLTNHMAWDELGAHLPHPAPDSGVAWMTFVDGGIGTLRFSNVAHLGAWEVRQILRLEGTLGHLVCDLRLGDRDHATVDTVVQGEGAPRHTTIDFTASEHLQHGNIMSIFAQPLTGARAFVAQIQGHTVCMPDFWDGVQAQLVVDAIQEAHRSRAQTAIVPVSRPEREEK
ncbi:Gfo/Idh/MocA family protein [Deinococcus arcticus]|uniref:Oxidoreductase n=1 Tax=Deinococcus arcticus TaxID=2136176 RepID=A0A2T3W3T4_9DEIO|nr:Gfo/Idh/MocA family oxidoreductase [Deinococcus arcticus]PTA66537.1 hypothetical protein C8263_17260 [Deinococcus arcticus]